MNKNILVLYKKNLFSSLQEGSLKLNIIKLINKGKMIHNIYFYFCYYDLRL